MAARLLDYLLWPALVIVPGLAANTLLALNVPPLLVTPLLVGPLAALIWLLERLRPERDAYREPDRPLWMEAAHFIFSFELGYGFSLLMCDLAKAGVDRLILIPAWPSQMPQALQFAVAILIYEATSYWQHRFLHEVPRLWRFHALHHSGLRLNFMRAARFHAVDIATASFVAYVPLVLWGAPDALFALLGVILSALGMLQHANIRMRTPAWLDAIVCTPAVHRWHHASDRSASDGNYGNTVMVFDLVFGTYKRPRPDGPLTVGIENDTMPHSFWRQWLDPFCEKPARDKGHQF